jgi:hypothetical protein
MKKSTIILCFLSVLAGTISAKAQSDTTWHHGWFGHNIAGAVQVQVTYRQSKPGQLNAILNNNQIGSLPGNNVWINLSMSHIHHRWLFEDGIGGTPTSTANNGNNLKVKHNQFQLYARGAYNVSKSSAFRLYPFVGLNLSDAMLRIQDNARTESTSDFSQELLNSTSSKTLWNPQFGLEFGGGFDYVIKMKSKQMDCYTIERNIPIGIRLGYYLQATSNKWKINDNYNLNNGPSNKQSAVFVSFNIGLGYEVKK